MPHELFPAAGRDSGRKAAGDSAGSFCRRARIPDSTACREDGRTLSVLSRGCGDFFKFEADLSFEEGTVFLVWAFGIPERKAFTNSGFSAGEQVPV